MHHVSQLVVDSEIVDRETQIATIDNNFVGKRDDFYYLLAIDWRSQSIYDGDMEKRITTLEVIADQTSKSIDRLDRSIADLRSDVDRKFSEVNNGIAELRKDFDRKFFWCIGSQFTALIAIIGLLTKIANIF